MRKETGDAKERDARDDNRKRARENALRMLQQGITNASHIARTVNISRSTVKTLKKLWTT